MQDWVVEVVREMGIVGIALLMFAENVFPPLPSEIIMPLAGYLSSRGEMELWPAVVAGSVGSLAGATVWYVVGRRVARGRFREWVREHGIWLALTPGSVDRAVGWFHGRGRYSVLLGRLVPVVRTLVSVPAGFSRMSVPRFLVLSSLGTVLWTAALAWVGRFLGTRFQAVESVVGPLSWAVIAMAALAYLYRVSRIHRNRAGFASRQR